MAFILLALFCVIGIIFIVPSRGHEQPGCVPVIPQNGHVNEENAAQAVLWIPYFGLTKRERIRLSLRFGMKS